MNDEMNIGKLLGEILTPEKTVRKYKVGRNDPCPCGSGKKYKKCCDNVSPERDREEYLVILYNISGESWQENYAGSRADLDKDKLDRFTFCLEDAVRDYPLDHEFIEALALVYYLKRDNEKAQEMLRRLWRLQGSREMRKHLLLAYFQLLMVANEKRKLLKLLQEFEDEIQDWKQAKTEWDREEWLELQVCYGFALLQRDEEEGREYIERAVNSGKLRQNAVDNFLLALGRNDYIRLALAIYVKEFTRLYQDDEEELFTKGQKEMENILRNMFSQPKVESATLHRWSSKLYEMITLMDRWYEQVSEEIASTSSTPDAVDISRAFAANGESESKSEIISKITANITAAALPEINSQEINLAAVTLSVLFSQEEYSRVIIAGEILTHLYGELQASPGRADKADKAREKENLSFLLTSIDRFRGLGLFKSGEYRRLEVLISENYNFTSENFLNESEINNKKLDLCLLLLLSWLKLDKEESVRRLLTELLTAEGENDDPQTAEGENEGSQTAEGKDEGSHTAEGEGEDLENVRGEGEDFPAVEDDDSLVIEGEDFPDVEEEDFQAVSSDSDNRQPGSQHKAGDRRLEKPSRRQQVVRVMLGHLRNIFGLPYEEELALKLIDLLKVVSLPQEIEAAYAYDRVVAFKSWLVMFKSTQRGITNFPAEERDKIMPRWPQIFTSTQSQQSQQCQEEQINQQSQQAQQNQQNQQSQQAQQNQQNQQTQQNQEGQLGWRSQQNQQAQDRQSPEQAAVKLYKVIGSLAGRTSPEELRQQLQEVLAAPIFQTEDCWSKLDARLWQLADMTTEEIKRTGEADRLIADIDSLLAGEEMQSAKMLSEKEIYFYQFITQARAGRRLQAFRCLEKSAEILGEILPWRRYFSFSYFDDYLNLATVYLPTEEIKWYYQNKEKSSATLKNMFLLRDDELLGELQHLEAAELVRELYRERDQFWLYNVIIAISERGEETTPPLLELLEDTAVKMASQKFWQSEESNFLETSPKDWGIIEWDEQEADLIRSMAPIYAMFILAERGEEQAYPLMLDIIAHPKKVVQQVLGDVLTEEMPQLLMSVYNGNLAALKEIIENEEISYTSRAVALDTLVCLVANKILEREEVEEYFAYLYREGLERKEKSYVWGFLTVATEILKLEGLKDEAEKAFARGLIDKDIFSPQEILPEITGDDKEEKLRELYTQEGGYKYCRPVTDAAELAASWFE